MSTGTKILIGVLVVMVLIIFFQWKCNRGTGELTSVDSTFYWRDKYGNEVASKKGLEEQFGVVQKQLDSIAKIHNVPPERIKEYVTVYQKGEAVIVTHEKPVITYVDSGTGQTIKNVFQMFENPYYIVEATIDLTGKDSSFARIETVDTLSVVWKEVREGGLFNKKRFLQVDVTNKNPYNHITGLDAYRVPLPKQKKFGIGVQAGYGMASGGLSPYVGVGIQYSVIRF